MADDVIVRRRVQRTGLALLQPADGLAGLSAVLSLLCDPHAAAPVAAVVPVDWSTFLRPAAGPGSAPAFFAEVQPPGPATHGGQQAALQAGQALGPPQAPVSEAAMQAVVLEVAQSVLGFAPPPDQPLMEAGLDSLSKCCNA